MTNQHLDMLSEIRARVAAANLTRPMRVRVGYEGSRHIPLIDYGERLDAEVVARTFEQDKPWPRAEMLAHAPSDLRWAIKEIEYLRSRVAALSHFAFAVERVRWALENPELARLERRRAEEAAARQALLAIPIKREGECDSGCRRYATHELITERDGEVVRREQRCEECARVRMAGRQSAMEAGLWPAATMRLEPIARPGGEGERG